MNIKELDTKTGYEFATVTLNYDELRCLNNSLYQLSKLDNIKKDENFNKVYAEIIELFTLVKYGMIPDFELEIMYKLLNNKEYNND